MDRPVAKAAKIQPNEPDKALDRLAREAIGAVRGVHRTLGPGLLESVYEEARCVELMPPSCGEASSAASMAPAFLALLPPLPPLPPWRFEPN